MLVLLVIADQYRPPAPQMMNSSLTPLDQVANAIVFSIALVQKAVRP